MLPALSYRSFVDQFNFKLISSSLTLLDLVPLKPHTIAHLLLNQISLSFSFSSSHSHSISLSRTHSLLYHRISISLFPFHIIDSTESTSLPSSRSDDATKRKKNSSKIDAMYGAMNPLFIEDCVVQPSQLGRSDSFLDIGSGIGQVVLQVAATVGCKSTGWVWLCNCLRDYYGGGDVIWVIQLTLLYSTLLHSTSM